MRMGFAGDDELDGTISVAEDFSGVPNRRTGDLPVYR